ncbi:alpha/beta hydrolase family protein [Corallococcus terminator]
MKTSGRPGTALPRALALATLLVAASASASTSIRGVGYRELAMKDPVNGGPLRGVVLYPSTQPSKPVPMDLLQLDAGKDLPPVSGRHPLVLISHGHMGTRWGHSDLASALARKGFVVASLDHAGNTHNDGARSGTDEVFLGRAWQVRTLLDSVLADPTLGPLVDPARVGAMGFSLGGYTVLLLGGASPDFDKLAPYCAEAAHQQSVLCTEMKAVRAVRPELRGGTQEPRIRSLFVMAPVGVFFDGAGLKDVKVPVRLYSAEKDEVLDGAAQALQVRDALPQQPEYTQVPKAGHFVFLAPCRPEMAKHTPEICVDPPGVDRVKLHRQLSQDAERFFSRTLASPTAKAP